MPSPSRLARLTAAATALVLLVAGCGDDKPAATSATVPETTTTTEAESTTSTTAAKPAGLPKPCELVTPTLAAQLLPGATLQAGVESGQGDNLSCTYAGDPSGPTAQVEVFVGSGAKKSLEIDRDTLAHDFTQTSGIGDEGWLEADNLYFRKGTTWVQLRVTTLDLQQEQIATNLATVASQIVDSI